MTPQPPPLVFAPDEDVVRDIDRWVGTPALRRLVEAWHGAWPTTGDLRTTVADLAEFSTAWDFRGGRNRLEIEELAADDDRSAMVREAAEALGLADQPSLTGQAYDAILVLGGLAASVQPRIDYTAELLRQGQVESPLVVLCGSFRKLHPDEETAATTYAPGAVHEVDLLRAMADHRFEGDGWKVDLQGDPEDAPRDAELHAVRAGAPELRLYAARSSDPAHRDANTGDNYRQFAADVALPPGQHLLVVTTHIYAVYQHWIAVKELGKPYGVHVETAGVPPAADGNRFGPSRFLQEVRSTILAANGLLTALG